MQNQLSTEESFVRALREMEPNQAPRDIVSRLKATPSQRVANHRWAYVGALATGAAAIAVVAIGLRPSYSLAQVAVALGRAEHYTVTYTDTQTDNGVVDRQVQYQLGGLWKTEFQQPVGTVVSYTIGERDRTIKVSHRVNSTIVTIDEPDNGYSNVSVDELLKLGGTPKVERNVAWGARKVDRFKVSGLYKPMNSLAPYREEVIVDPSTRLPLHVRMEIDEKECPKVSEWDYDYSAPNPSVFAENFPKDAKIFDLRAQRKELANMVLAKSVGALIISENGSGVALLNEAPPKRNYTAQLTFDGSSAEHRGMIINVHRLIKPKKMSEGFQTLDNLNTLALVHVGNRDWYAMEFYSMGDLRGSASGSIKYLSTNVSFKDVPVLRTSNEISLLKGFPSKPGVNWLK